jgi:hypothetical protein
MARYEGSPEDEAEDARGAKAMGVSKKQYEKSGRDKREDRAGEKRTKRKAPSPAPRQAPVALATPPGGGDDFADDDIGTM